MKTDVIFIVLLYLVMAAGCLIGLVVRHSAGVVFTKKMLMYGLGAVAVTAALGAAFARSESLVTVFWWLEGLALLLGVLHLMASRRLFSYVTDGHAAGDPQRRTDPVGDHPVGDHPVGDHPVGEPFWSALLLAGAMLFLMAGAFTGLFQGLQRSDRFLPALTLGLLPFLLPMLFLCAQNAWQAIPPKIYRKWFYPVDRAVPLIELNDTVRLNFRVAKAPDAPALAEYTVKAPIDRTLHDLFHYMIYSHNAEENPEQPILYHEYNHEGSLLGWIFYKQSLGGLSKQFLDPALTLTRSGIKSNDVIIARSFTND